MRTNRITLLVTKAEKARIAREAAALGASEGDYVRKAAMLLDAEDVVALEDVRSLLPEFNAALTRIHDNLTAAAERREKCLQEIERMRTPEYREEVRRSVMEDRAGLEAVAALVGFAPPRHATSPTESPGDETPGERPSKIAKVRSQVNEGRDPWNEGEVPGERKPSR